MKQIPENPGRPLGPLVSVVVPAFDAQDTIGETLNSIMGQTYAHMEIIVIDDGSTDRTGEIVSAMAERDPRIRLIRQNNAGVAAARNRGIAESRGSLVAPVDADDIWFSRNLEKQVARMTRTDDPVHVVYGWSLEIDEQSRLSGGFHCGRFEGWVFWALLQAFFIGHASATLIHRKCFEAVGDYDSGLRAKGAEGCEDWDLYLRVAERFRFGVVREFTIGYRHGPGNMSARHDTMKRSYDLVLEKVRVRRPEIAACWYRRSRANFRLYLAMRSLESGLARNQMAYVREALRLDPVAALLRHDACFGPLLLLMKRLRNKFCGSGIRLSTLSRRIGTRKYLPFVRLHAFRVRHVPGLYSAAGSEKRRPS